MIFRKGSSLLSTVLTVAAVAAVGGAGVMTLTGNGLCSMMGGDCGAACGDAKAPASQVVMASDTGSADASAKSCCPLGDLAKKNTDAQVTPTVASEKASGCCEKKADCASKCGGMRTIAASDAAKSSCGDKADCASKCGSGAMQVVAAADTSKKASCGDKADCGSKCGGAVMQTASASAKDVCGPCPVATFNTRLVAFSSMLKGSSSCCDKPCGDSATATMAAGPTAAHMMSSSGVIVPAMFVSSQKLDRSTLSASGCCRSKAKNASATSECGEAKSCCEKGVQVINTAAEGAEKSNCAGCSDASKCASKCGEKKDCGSKCAGKVAVAG